MDDYNIIYYHCLLTSLNVIGGNWQSCWSLEVFLTSGLISVTCSDVGVSCCIGATVVEVGSRVDTLWSDEDSVWYCDIIGSLLIGRYCIVVDPLVGKDDGWYCVAIGSLVGKDDGWYCVAIGPLVGKDDGWYCVAIGPLVGKDGGWYCVAIGPLVGKDDGWFCVVNDQLMAVLAKDGSTVIVLGSVTNGGLLLLVLDLAVLVLSVLGLETNRDGVGPPLLGLETLGAPILGLVTIVVLATVGLGLETNVVLGLLATTVSLGLLYGLEMWWGEDVDVQTDGSISAEPWMRWETYFIINK